MPLYEYECESCGRRFERIQKFSDPLETICPTCGGSVHKLISSPAFQFKGSGFYITDYPKAGKTSDTEGSGKGKSDAKPSTDAPASSDKADSTSTPAKTESTSDSKPADSKPAESKKSDPAKPS